MRSRYLESFAKKLPVLFIVTVIIGLLTGGLLLGRWDYSVRALIIAIPSIIASIILFFMVRTSVVDTNDEHLYLVRTSLLSYYVFILLYFVSIIIVLTEIHRFMYYSVISLLYFLVFIQIFSREFYPHVIISEIIFILMNIIYGTTLTYPLFFRTTDILLHNTASGITLLSGHTIPVDLSTSYATFPLFHIFNAMSSNILGLSVQGTHFLVMCLAYVIVVLFLYKIFLILSHNEQISMLGCLSFSIFPIVLLEGIMFVTRTAAFVGFIILLYLIFTAKEKHSTILTAFFFLISIFIILVHQVSVAQIALIIALLMTCELALVNYNYFSVKKTMFIIISFCSYWIFTSKAFLEWLVGARTHLDYTDFGEKKQFLADPSLDQMQVAILYLQNQIDMGIFLFFALIGITYIIYRQKPQYLPVIAIFTLFAMGLYVPNPLFTSQTIASIYRIDRFWILISPFMAIAMASGIFWLNAWIQKYTGSKLYHSLVAFLFALFILLSLQQPILDITSKEGRLYFTDGELSGYSYIHNNVPYGSELYADYHTARFFHLNYFSLTEELGLPFFTSNMLSGMTWFPQDNEYVIFRELKFNDHAIHIRVENGTGIMNYLSTENNKQEVDDFFDNNNLIYRNDQISIIIGL